MPYVEEYSEDSIYDESFRDEMQEDDEISAEELAFMKGYEEAR